MITKLYISVFIIAMATLTRVQAQGGDLDSTFSDDGKVTTDFGTLDDEVSCMAIQSDGKIIVAGFAHNQFGTYYDFALSRYNTDGSLDNSFDDDGTVVTDFNGRDDIAYSIAIQPDGKIIAAGSTSNGDADFAVARYNSDGSLDNTFGLNGKLIINSGLGGNHDEFRSVVLQPNGKILLGGTAVYSGLADDDFFIKRLNANGSVDNTFDGDGQQTTNFVDDDYISTLLLQPDGKIIAVGKTAYGQYFEIALARYKTDGSIDSTFGINGKVTSLIGQQEDVANSAVLLTDGKILIGGRTMSNNTTDFLLVKYKVDGTIDSTFGNNGTVITDYNGADNSGNSLAVQPDGKIVLAGTTSANFVVLRYNASGSLDPGFGSGGIITTDFYSGSLEGANSVALQTDGKIVAAGSFSAGSDVDFAVARYLPDLNIGIVEFSASGDSAYIYPNPIAKNATLEFTLKKDESVSIQLVDMKGRFIKSFLRNEKITAGFHSQEIDLPENLPSGYYIIAISSAAGSESIRIEK